MWLDESLQIVDADRQSRHAREYHAFDVRRRGAMIALDLLLFQLALNLVPIWREPPEIRLKVYEIVFFFIPDLERKINENEPGVMVIQLLT